MSINTLDKKNNKLIPLAVAPEIPRWTGTLKEWEELDKSTLEDGTYVEFTDDLSDLLTSWTGTTSEFRELNKSTLADGCYLNFTDDENSYNENYSLVEINTGKKWIDGKDIFRKVYVYKNSIPLDTDVSIVDYSDLNVDTVISCNGYIKSNTQQAFLPCAYNHSGTFYYAAIDIRVQEKKLVLRQFWSGTADEALVIIEYTKGE